MKHNAISSKKLIKNLVYLIVSALVLVSATVAWFASGDMAEVSTISTPMQTSLFNIEYYRADVTGREFVYENGAISSLTREEKEGLSWVQTGNIDVESLYPGVFNAFKIVVKANSSMSNSSLLFDEISCLVPSDSKDVYDSVFISAQAYTQDGTLVSSASGSFSSFIPEGSDSMSIFGLGAIAQSQKLIIYIDIGIPGYDVNNTHDKIRLTGADIRIGSVSVSD